MSYNGPVGNSTAGNNRMVHVIHRVETDWYTARCGARVPKRPQSTQDTLPECKRCHGRA